MRGANYKEIYVAFKIQDVYERSPLAHDLAVHLELFMIVALHHQHNMLAYHEVCILVLIGVVTHTGHAVREVAENAAALFAGDHRKAAGAYGVALLRTKEGVDFRFFRGNNQFTGARMILFYNAVDL